MKLFEMIRAFWRQTFVAGVKDGMAELAAEFQRAEPTLIETTARRIEERNGLDPITGQEPRNGKSRKATAR